MLMIICGAHDYITAENLKYELTELLSKGKFELHKWASNDATLLSKATTKTNTISNVLLMDNKNCIKTLGLSWNPSYEKYLLDDTVLRH